jgi:hypothetical protein
VYLIITFNLISEWLLRSCEGSILTHRDCSSPDLSADRGRILWARACDPGLVLAYLRFGTMVEAQEQGRRPSSILRALVKTRINNLSLLLGALRRRRVGRYSESARQPGLQIQPVQPALSFGILDAVLAKERHVRCRKSRNIPR